MLSPMPDTAAQSALDPSQLYRLMAWLSPAYPVGTFSYSSGLEWAVEAGDILDAGTLCNWLQAIFEHGGIACDAGFFVHAYKGAVEVDDFRLRGFAELSAALAPSKERHLETTAQRRAFVDTTQTPWPCAALERLLGIWD